MANKRSELDHAVLDAAERVVAEHGLAGLTIERLAEAAGTSRMTLHRRGITRQTVVDSLEHRAIERYFAAIWPALISPERAAARLANALDAICDVADQHLALLAGTFADVESPFHGTPSEQGGVTETQDSFVAPIARILLDGAADGTLAFDGEATETAAVLFNVVGWGYIHLRHAQRWPAERARPAVIGFATASLRAKKMVV